MLRRFAGPRRRPDEDYLSSVVRATHEAEDNLRAAGLQPCLLEYLHRKWCWAGRILRMDFSRWTRRVTVWRDRDWWRQQPRDFLRPTGARHAHWFRWEDILVRYAESHSWDSWQKQAMLLNEDDWALHAASFAEFGH